MTFNVIFLFISPHIYLLFFTYICFGFSAIDIFLGDFYYVVLIIL